MQGYINMIQIIINRPDGEQSVITNPPENAKLLILVSPEQVEIQEKEILVDTGKLDNNNKPIYQVSKISEKVIVKEVEYRQETNEEWLTRVAEQAVENCRLNFGEGEYSYNIINN